MTSTPDGDWKVTHAYDTGDETASEAVVRAVAAATDHDVMTLDPLYDAVETDALDGLFENEEADVNVAFRYADCRVELEPGTVVVSPSTGR